MTERFFVEPPIEGPLVTLRGGEALHALRVMRLNVGDRITVFDGGGSEWSAQVTAVARNSLVVRLSDERQVSRESGCDVILVVALPKGDRQRWLIEKATELGVARLIPLISGRSVAMPGGKTREKLERFVIAASKQCGRNRLMEIGEPLPFVDALQMDPESEAHPRLLADPLGSAWHVPPTVSRVTALVGPEGGFTDDERAMAMRAGFHLVSLGPRILRVETAALALAARLA